MSLEMDTCFYINELRYRAELDAQPDILETDKSPAKVLPSERRGFWQVFTREQEKQLTEYLKAASLMNHGLTGLSTRKLAYEFAVKLNIPLKKNSWKKKSTTEKRRKPRKKTPQKKITKTKKMVGRRQTKVGNKRKPSAFIRLSVSETSSSGPELPDDICDDESDMSLDLGEDDVVASDRPVSPIQIGKFVLVKFELGKSKSSCVYYVGLVESIDNDVADVKFLRKIGPKFVFPEIEDKATVDKKDIVLVLPDPSSSGGTARSIAGHVFSRDFSAFNIK
ncbi:hypothetical protein QYM36_015997 [Artemia franciscana]|uniref:Uncharacterized protein n=1 Tax=Artemia franciscana TaxID=6661 RepID=A0AA88KW14_ARTSF|nr:hypothetical protein QYM36_015997 [Artemia franciscana]